MLLRNDQLQFNFRHKCFLYHVHKVSPRVYGAITSPGKLSPKLKKLHEQKVFFFNNCSCCVQILERSLQ